MGIPHLTNESILSVPREGYDQAHRRSFCANNTLAAIRTLMNIQLVRHMSHRISVLRAPRASRLRTGLSRSSYASEIRAANIRSAGGHACMRCEVGHRLHN